MMGAMLTARRVRRCANGDTPRGAPAAAVGILTRHAPAAARMNDFYWKLFDGDIHAEYPRWLHRCLPLTIC